MQRRVYSKDTGQTLIMFVLFMLTLVAFVGLGIDLGFAYITRARLSKAVDAACLAGIRSYSSTAVAQATDIAKSAFQANYGTSGRDAVSPYPPKVLFDASGPNITLDVNATATINTFFIRVLPALFPGGPSWQTLTVGSHAQATRPNLIMSIVLDRSGSMGPVDQGGDGGMDALKATVPVFINHFDDVLDRASMISFSYAATVGFPMGRPFKDAITTAVNALTPVGWTASEQGLLKGWQQNESVTPQGDEKIVRVIVFFTDGLANTWQPSDLFKCGTIMRTNNVGPDLSLYDPVTGAGVSGCSFPSCLHSINPPYGCVSTTKNCDQGSGHNNVASGMYNEAEARAEYWAQQARLQGNVVYAIGLGDPNGAKECGRSPINPVFLQTVANDPNGPNFVGDGSQPQGIALIANSADELPQIFEQIASAILARLTR
ncbi:MAG TPA: pilus assembly protein TadG-related protein [Verrucomicrobiae bacterium]|nr:pilus assembly protein TadG-related protein [Verrucomicrobiae bacterium]